MSIINCNILIYSIKQNLSAKQYQDLENNLKIKFKLSNIDWKYNLDNDLIKIYYNNNINNELLIADYIRDLKSILSNTYLKDCLNDMIGTIYILNKNNDDYYSYFGIINHNKIDLITKKNYEQIHSIKTTLDNIKIKDLTSLEIFNYEQEKNKNEIIKKENTELIEIKKSMNQIYYYFIILLMFIIGFIINTFLL